MPYAPSEAPRATVDPLDGVLLLPSGRVGRLTPIATKSGNPIYRGVDGSLLCQHGEVRSFVSSKIAARASRDGGKVLDDCGACDCENMDGLYTESDKTPRPPGSTSLFELLGKTGAEEVLIAGRPIRRACTTGSLADVWIGPINNVVCRHGNGRTRRNKKGGCGCVLVIPRRKDSAFKQCKRSGTKSRLSKTQQPKEHTSSGDEEPYDYEEYEDEPMQTGA